MDENEIEKLKEEVETLKVELSKKEKEIDGYEMEKKTALINEILTLEKGLKMENSSADDLMKDNISGLNGRRKILLDMSKNIDNGSLKMENTADDGVDVGATNGKIKETWDKVEGSVADKLRKAMSGEIKIE